MRTELERIDENADQNGPMGRGRADELTVACMKTAHGGDELHTTRLGGTPGMQISPRFEKGPLQRRTSSFTWAMPDAVKPRELAAP